jgi:hypothetical protein
MPDYPKGIYAKAAEAIERELLSGRDYGTHMDSDEALARAALDAVAEDLGGAVAAKILAHMEGSGPPLRVKLRGDAAVRRTMRRLHFGAAASIASRAFLTAEDVMRQVAVAIERGDFAHCPGLEDGDER